MNHSDRFGLTITGSLVESVLLLLALVMTLSACSMGPSRSRAEFGADSWQAHRWLPGHYLGESPTGPVYHQIVALDIPELGGAVFYHHISRVGFGLASFQRKFYRFDQSGQVMRSTVVLPAGENLGGNDSLKKFLSQLSDKDVLTFSPQCLFRWSAGESGLTAQLAAEHCAYNSPAFGGTISPQMTYQLDPCSLSIDEALFRDSGEPVFPPSSIYNRRVSPSGQPVDGC